jgi:hypothetical protein
MFYVIFAAIKGLIGYGLLGLYDYLKIFSNAIKDCWKLTRDDLREKYGDWIR